jgi:hypothetical protein
VTSTKARDQELLEVARETTADGRGTPDTVIGGMISIEMMIGMTQAPQEGAVTETETVTEIEIETETIENEIDKDKQPAFHFASHEKNSWHVRPRIW